MANIFYNYNGKLFDNDQNVISSSNRSFRYGDGFFETIKVINGEIKLKQYHEKRILESLLLLKFQLPKLFSVQKIFENILQLSNKNNHQNCARVRLVFFRGDGGLYDAENNNPNYIIQTYSLSKTLIELNENGLNLDFYREAKKNIDRFSHLKTNSFLTYAMAALWAKENKLNDAIVINCINNIADTTIANLFIVKNKKIKTPKLQDGCIAGVARDFLMDTCKNHNIEIDETTLTEQDVLTADEVFTTNAIKGINWVSTVKNNSYKLGDTTLRLALLFKQLC